MNMPIGYTLDQLQEFYNECTLAERLEVVQMMLARIDARKQKDIDTCKADPSKLSNLSASALRDLSSFVSFEAHYLIMSACPEVRKVLTALEGLTAFRFSEKEPTEADLKAARNNIEFVWSDDLNNIDVARENGAPSAHVVKSISRPKRKAR
jgi:hypothetical protein